MDAVLCDRPALGRRKVLPRSSGACQHGTQTDRSCCSVGSWTCQLVTVLVPFLQCDHAPRGCFLVQPVTAQGDVSKSSYMH